MLTLLNCILLVCHLPLSSSMCALSVQLNHAYRKAASDEKAAQPADDCLFSPIPQVSIHSAIVMPVE